MWKSQELLQKERTEMYTKSLYFIHSECISVNSDVQIGEGECGAESRTNFITGGLFSKFSALIDVFVLQFVSVNTKMTTCEFY